jgi:signal transduction histidine kinase
MRSIFAKIFLWSLGTFVLSLIAFWAISHTIDRRMRGGDPFPRMIALIEDDACRVYEEGGAERLAAHLKRLNVYLHAEHILTDSKGRDLATGEDRSDLIRRSKVHKKPGRLEDGRIVFVGRPRHGKYYFINIVRPLFEPSDILPYYSLIVVVIAAMGFFLAVHLAAPLRGLREVVERFGRGDLAAREHSIRKDEIGELSRAFDEMAGRIETLLLAERRLLQDVSHELRSPLARLGFAVELARSGPDRDRALDRVRKEADRMSTLIGELIELTRFEGDRTACDAEIIDPDSLLDHIIKDCQWEAEARRRSIAFKVESSVTIRGVYELLRRAVENVVRNAIRHTPEGTTVEVELSHRDGRALIRVRDFGAGVPEAALDAIFKPFFRVEVDRDRASGGVGLGLAIALRAVELHGGGIKAKNASPGLEVTIELPAAGENV